MIRLKVPLMLKVLELEKDRMVGIFLRIQTGKPVQMNLSCITVFWDGRI